MRYRVILRDFALFVLLMLVVFTPFAIGAHFYEKRLDDRRDACADIGLVYIEGTGYCVEAVKP